MLAVAVQHVKTQPQPLESASGLICRPLSASYTDAGEKPRSAGWNSCSEVLRELYRIQLEYCPQPTPEEAAAWSATGMEPMSEPRMRATRQLAEAMRDLRAAAKKVVPQFGGPGRRGIVRSWAA